MGRFVYAGTANPIDIEDRALAHLRMVMMNKLRRGESFMFDVILTDGSGGRRSLWIHPSIPIGFQFYGSRRPRLNRNWIDALMSSANSPNGLVLVPEPEEDGAPAAPLMG